MRIKEYYPKFFELWTEGHNNLLHHNFSFGFIPEHILIFFSAPAQICQSVFLRLLQLFPTTKFSVVVKQNQLESHPYLNAQNIDIFAYSGINILQADYVNANLFPKICNLSIDVVLFCNQINLWHNADPQQIFEANGSYRNLGLISDLLNNPHTYFIGPQLKVHPVADLFPKKTIQTITGDYVIPDSLMSCEELQVLYECVRLIPKDTMILEIGHYLGGSTICIGKGALDGNRNPIVTIDRHSSPYPGSQEIFLENIRKFTLTEHVTPYFISVDEFISKIWPEISSPLGLLFMDSDKEFSHILSCCLFWSQYLVAGGFLILEDYSSNPGVMEATQVFLREKEKFRIYAEHPPMLVVRKFGEAAV